MMKECTSSAEDSDCVLGINRLKRLDTAIDIGIRELDRGEGIPGDEVFEALRERSRRRRTSCR